jgi:hypothetical protein
MGTPRATNCVDSAHRGSGCCEDCRGCRQGETHQREFVEAVKANICISGCSRAVETGAKLSSFGYYQNNQQPFTHFIFINRIKLKFSYVIIKYILSM